MQILAIDTSCDDTCVAVLEIRNLKLEIKTNIVSSQVEVHRKYGGVYPTLAKREHQRNLVPVLKKALREAKLLEGQTRVRRGSDPRLTPILEREPKLLKDLTRFFQDFQKPKIDAIAVTVGPGLEPCLWMGVNFTRALAYWWDVPIIPVNHIEAHIAANFIGENPKSQIRNPKQILNPNNQNSKPIKFPAVCLVVSGGHTQLILMKKIGDYKIIGETRDDAAGECLDKTARLLGLGYPGGPAITAAATNTKNSNKFTMVNLLPRPMINSKDYDFSFSGLKTAVLYDFKSRSKEVRTSKEYVRAMAKEIQQAIVDVLLKKTLKAARDFRAKTIMLGGGVAANNELRKQFAKEVEKLNHGSRITIQFPPRDLCTDNAAMVAMAGYFNLKNKKPWRDIKVNANLRL